MKLGRGFKPVFLWTSFFLYATGLAAWALATHFQIDTGYGLEPSPMKSRVLHAHSVAGFLFLALFGYLWHAHVEPGLRHQKKKLSGLTLVGALAALFLTVPLLFYLTGEAPRAWTAAIHTWLGAALLAPFLFHLRSKRAG